MFRSLRENLVMKLLALITSIMIWLYVEAERNPMQRRQINAQIKIVGKAPDNLIVRVRPDMIPVEVSGPRSEVEALDENPDPLPVVNNGSRSAIRAVIDLNTVNANSPRLLITSYERPEGASRVTVKGLRQYVNVEVTRKLRKPLTITPSFNNAAPFGRRFTTPRLVPSEAFAVGTQPDLQQVDKLVVFIDSQDGGVRDELPIRALDKDGVVLDNVQVEPPATRVQLGLVEAPAERTLLISAPTTGQPPAGHIVTDILIEPAQVTLIGNADRLLTLTHVSTAEISLEGIQEDTVRQAPLQLPPDISVKGGRAMVRVTIKVRALPGTARSGTPQNP
jgi:YbbR domain-containing protein